ncbi:xanthine dehydrogenase [Roseivivax halodurans JCM 10272]|uniref:Xanthine dehydrogenase n=1 Tax=Roseivivax halodurans JCM 10272 TaxID=1449350 RepID=X7EAF2_9RHOB|nr:xanthine dehydrogenase family protein molybdopterin-binding subunit [Roseivivax halodurans]ETX13064.1 xanthine dehydrogenase [Roseivivax halodurans JCM 10272]
MTKAFRMDEVQPRLLDETNQNVIGQPLARPEGYLKVSGQAPYAAEVDVGEMAHGVLVRATITKGRVLRVHDEKIRKMDGVVDVHMLDRMIRNPAQGMMGESPEQLGERIDYLGQPIGVVVAEDFETARDAALQLEIEYSEEEAEVDPDNASNTEWTDKEDYGDIDTAMDRAEFTVDSEYHTAAHVAAAMEPHAAIAVWEGEKLTLHGSCQLIKFNVKELADALGIAEENVHILSPYIGGGFGSKLGISPEAVAASIAARDLGKPVRVVMSRQQVFDSVLRRTETTQRLFLGADADGRLTAVGHHDRVSNVPNEGFSEPTNQATHFLYSGANRRYSQETARIHRTPSGSVRAPGEAVGMLALETAMDELAETARLDPVELRLRNIPETHPETGVPYSARMLAECLKDGAKEFGWNQRKAPRERKEGDWFLGMGVASAARMNMLLPSEARVTLTPTGAIVETDMTDIGTGTYAILNQITAEMLGLPVELVEVRLGDSSYPSAAGSGGSFGAASSGSSVFLACKAIREQIAKKMDCEGDDLTLSGGIARCGNREKKLEDLLDADIVETAQIKPGKTGKEAFSSGFGAHFAEVAVHEWTGEVRVKRMAGWFAAGRILNERTARSQCWGGMIWGIGSALHEHASHDPRRGHIVNRDLANYHVPASLDVPQLDVTFLDERDDHANPIQAKGIGELGISGAGAAVTNAIYNACGVRIRTFPATPDIVLEGLMAYD